MAAGTGSPAGAFEQVVSLDAAQRTQSLVNSVSQAWLSVEWRSYAARFIAPEGRVIDNANGGVSHSEGQGYGMLLAAKAGDAARFDALWRWTAHTLQIRKDGLLAWKWDPAAKAVTDTNNATDGDILVAWALLDARRPADRPRARAAAGRHGLRARGAGRRAGGQPIVLGVPGLRRAGRGRA
jgi:endoglucanase